MHDTSLRALKWHRGEIAQTAEQARRLGSVAALFPLGVTGEPKRKKTTGLLGVCEVCADPETLIKSAWLCSSLRILQEPATRRPRAGVQR